MDNYKACHWAKVPAHAVVARDDSKVDDIWNFLSKAQVLSSCPFLPLESLLLSSDFACSLQLSKNFGTVICRLFSLNTGKIWCGHKQLLPPLWATWQEGPSPQRLAFQRLCCPAEAYPSTDGFPTLPGL